MTREEQIREASIDYQLSTNQLAIGGDAFADMARAMNVNPSFIAGAKWADKTMIERACEFIAEWFYEHPHTNMVCSDEFESVDQLLEKLKKAMEGQQ